MREAGLEPARPEWTLEPESSESANSTTRASLRLRYYTTAGNRLSRKIFSFSGDSEIGLPQAQE